MPSQRFNTVFAANQVIQNILAGSQFEFIGTPSRVQIYAVADTGTGPVDCEVTFGQELQIPASPLPAVAVGTGPVAPDNLLIDDIAAPGDRIVIRQTETGGAAAAARTLVVITPLA